MKHLMYFNESRLATTKVGGFAPGLCLAVYGYSLNLEDTNRYTAK